MKFTQVFTLLAFSAQQCLAASVDMFSSLQARDVPIYESIDPQELRARLGTTPAEYNPEERHPGIVRIEPPHLWQPLLTPAGLLLC